MKLSNSLRVNINYINNTDRYPESLPALNPFTLVALIGVSFKTADISLREKIAINLKNNYKKLIEAKKQGIISGASIISTCNRAEIVFSFNPNEENLLNYIQEFLLSELFCLNLDSKSSDVFYFLKSDEVSEHLFRVSTGLDSMITGEAQILGQIKSSYKEAVSYNLLDSSLHKLFQSAFRAAKIVRTSTGIGKGTVSIAAASRLAIKSIFPDLSSLKFLIIGAGETATLMGRYLRDSGARSFFITNRSSSRSKTLAKLLDGVSIPFSKRFDILPMVDVIISAVQIEDQDAYLLNLNEVLSSFDNQISKNIILIDVSVPRSIDPKISEIPSVYLFDIDDFKTINTEAINSRLQEADRATALIKDEVSKFRRWQNDREKNLLISKLNKSFKNENEREWLRTNRKLDKSGFSPEELLKIKELFNLHIQSTFSRFTHPVYEYLHSSSSNDKLSLVEDIFLSSDFNIEE